MILENYQPLGTLSRLHGIHGEALLIAGNKLSKDFNKTEWVILVVDGLPVPFFISSIRIKSESTAFIKFDNITSAEELEEYIGLDVYIPQSKQAKARKKTVKNDIKGYTVIDSIHGNIGIAETVIDYQENFVLQIFKDKVEVLIPVNEEIIKEIDDKKKCIFIDAPEGLIELYL